MIFSNYIEQIIRNLETEGESYIAKLIADSTEENLQLEFKTKREPSELKLHADDKQNLGKTLSGFSNAEGGIVIWGVGTTKENGIDKASQSRPIADVRNSFEVFRNQCATTIQPENQNIKFLCIKCSADNAKGYIAIAIPKGPARPHMSKAPGHNKYFRRTLNGFDPLQHYEVVDMMRAEVDPEIVLNWTLIQEGTGTSGTDYSIRLLQYNVGLVSAIRPYTIFENWPANLKHGVHFMGNLRIDPPEIGSRAVIPSYEFDALIPGGIREFLTLMFHTKASDEGPFHWGRTDQQGAANFVQDLEFSATVGAENGTAKKTHFKLTLNELREKCMSRSKI